MKMTRATRVGAYVSPRGVFAIVCRDAASGVEVERSFDADPGFTGVDLRRVDLWLPLHTTQALLAGTWWVNGRNGYWLRPVIRLADGTYLVGDYAEGAAATGVAKAVAADDRIRVDDDPAAQDGAVVHSPADAKRVADLPDFDDAAIRPAVGIHPVAAVHAGEHRQ